jgi:aspartate/methionine/tyrosine aminotransferase
VLAEVARDPRSALYEPDPRGDRAAREAIAAYHTAPDTAWSPDSIVLTAGTSEGYAHLFRLPADAGERVLVPSPSYPLFGLLAGLESVEAEPYPLRVRAVLRAVAGEPADRAPAPSGCSETARSPGAA